MSKQRLKIINIRNSLKHRKQWYKGKKYKLKGTWTVSIQEFPITFGLNAVEELSDFIIKEIQQKRNKL